MEHRAITLLRELNAQGFTLQKLQDFTGRDISTLRSLIAEGRGLSRSNLDEVYGTLQLQLNSEDAWNFPFEDVAAGNQYRRERKWKDAATSLQSALQSEYIGESRYAVSIKLAQCYVALNQYEEAKRLIAEISSDSLDDEDHAELDLLNGSIAFITAEWDKAEVLLTEARSVFFKLKKYEQCLNIDIRLATILMYRGDLSAARIAITKAFALSKREGDGVRICQMLLQFARLCMYENDITQMKHFLNRGMKLAEAAKTPLNLTVAYDLMGHYHLLSNEASQASDWFSKAMAVAEQANLTDRVIVSTAGKCVAASRLGQAASVLPELHRVFEMAIKIASTHLVECHYAYAVVLQALQKLDEAGQHAFEGMTLAQQQQQLVKVPQFRVLLSIP